jgi:alkylation response protein AidB-like acyl-CoA dehydrogenase
VILRDEDLETWQQVVRDFLAAVEIRVLPAGPRVDRTRWRRACGLGVAGLDVPEALGGTEAGFSESVAGCWHPYPFWARLSRPRGSSWPLAAPPSPTCSRGSCRAT